MGLQSKELEADVQRISQEIGVPSDFLIGLLQEKDWSFVIKIHAFMEALITHAISDALCRKELTDVLSRIEMANVQAGKVAIAKALQLIGDDGKRFLTKLSSLRNSLVHDIKRIGFEFSRYLASLDKNQAREFVNAFTYWASDEDRELHIDLVRELARENPKYSVWLSTMHFTGLMLWKRDVEKMRTLKLSMQADLSRMKKVMEKTAD